MTTLNEFHVPSNSYPTIQSAIDDPKLEVINIGPGKYSENLVIKRSVVLKGAGANTTMIDGKRAGSVIAISNKAKVLINGFTITGGDATKSNGQGGGIQIIKATGVTITNNVIMDNIASTDVNIFGWGGGVYAEESSEPILIENNIIQNNIAFSVRMLEKVIEDNGGGNGGGIAIGSGIIAFIKNNTITNNLGYTKGDDTGFPYFGKTWGGGGIYTRADEITIDGNTITDNIGGIKGNVGNGGGINIAFGDVIITNNIIKNNIAVTTGAFGQGGGINCTAQFHKLFVSKNIIENNKGAIDGSAQLPSLTPFISYGGGGIHVFGTLAQKDNSVHISENQFIRNTTAKSIIGFGGQGSVVGGGGGGAYIASCNQVVFEKNQVIENISIENINLSGPGAFGGGQGAGLTTQACKSVLIDHNEFSKNLISKSTFNLGSIGSNNGGGISIWRTPHAVITNNIITDNKCVEHATNLDHDMLGIYLSRGGGIYVDDAELPDFDGPPNLTDIIIIKGNKIKNNICIDKLNTLSGDTKSIIMGGGIYVGNITNVEISENDISDNVNTSVQTPNVINLMSDIAFYKDGKTVVEKNNIENNKLYTTTNEWLVRDIKTTPQFYPINIGKIKCIALNDGTLSYLQPSGFLFANAPQNELKKVINEYKFPSNFWKGTYTCLYIDNGKNKILLDTGMGAASPSTNMLIPNLLAAGIQPEEIDTIIITHAHPDHIGGNCDSEGKIKFPNAKFMFWKEEWDFWTKNPDLSNLPWPDFFKNNLLVFNGSQLPLIAHKVELIEKTGEIFEGISVIPAIGHTPGQILIKISSENESLVYASDLILHPIHCEHPDWFSMLDMNPELTYQSRIKVMEELSNDNAMVLNFHFDFPGLGKIVKNGKVWKWENLQ